MLVKNCWWKAFGGQFLLEIFGGKFVGNFGGKAIFDILRPPAFQKYSKHRVFEELLQGWHWWLDGGAA